MYSHTTRERCRLSAGTPTCPHIAEDQRIPMVHRDARVVLHPDTQGFVSRARKKSPIRIAGRRVPTLESSYAGNNHVTFPAPKLGIEAIATGPITRRGDGWSSGHRRRNDEVNGGKEDGDNKPGGSHTVVHEHDSFRVEWQGGLCYGSSADTGAERDGGRRQGTQMGEPQLVRWVLRRGASVDRAVGVNLDGDVVRRPSHCPSHTLN